jgi:hypothetical protein
VGGVSPTGTPAARYCRYHCAACGCHFTSLDAFDAHRDGEDGKRWCDNPAHVVRRGSGRRALLPNAGRCRLSFPGGESATVDATVWETA